MTGLTVAALLGCADTVPTEDTPTSYDESVERHTEFTMNADALIPRRNRHRKPRQRPLRRRSVPSGVSVEDVFGQGSRPP